MWISQKACVGRKMRERQIVLLGLRVDQNGVALVEGAALRILPGEAHGIAFENQRAEGEQFGEAVIDGALAMAHFGALLEQLDDFGMDMKSGWRAHQSIGDFREFFGGQAGVDFDTPDRICRNCRATSSPAVCAGGEFW